ncbi:MAG TPA: hypothetical protein VGM82_00990 [Gemmatimonadaceae bacterium]|jgi:hypothetical protein
MPFLSFKTKDEIPKGFEDVYEEKEGEWHPLLPDAAKSQETLAKVRAERDTFKRSAAQLRDQIDAAGGDAVVGELQRKIDSLTAANEQYDTQSKKLLENVESDKIAAITKATGALTLERDQLQGQLSKVLIDDRIRSEFLKAGGRGERTELALQLARRDFDLVDGEVVHKNEKGEVTTTKIGDYFANAFKTLAPEFYTGTKASGGGATGGSGTKPAPVDPALFERLLQNPLGVLRETNSNG